MTDHVHTPVALMVTALNTISGLSAYSSAAIEGTPIDSLPCPYALVEPAGGASLSAQNPDATVLVLDFTVWVGDQYGTEAEADSIVGPRITACIRALAGLRLGSGWSRLALVEFAGTEPGDGGRCLTPLLFRTTWTL
jgi:hypothetical protein